MKVCSSDIHFTSRLMSDLFQLNKKWYVKIDIQTCIEHISEIDNKCALYATRINIFYRSCIFDNSILVKIPYRYNRYEAICENATFYELKRVMDVDVDFSAISISEFKSGVYTCCFKLNKIKLNCLKKHFHAPVECVEGESIL